MKSHLSAPPSILGLGTALPEHLMTQDEAVALAQEVCCRDDDERRLVKALYRKAGVKSRYTVLPHRIAVEWVTPSSTASAVEQAATIEGGASAPTICESAVAESAAQTLGPTTRERMGFYRDAAPGLALSAAAAALREAATPADAITHLVTVSCTGFFSPGVDLSLIEVLGLRPTVGRIHVGFMGCHGAINGLRAAAALAQADPRHRVLLCAVELCSLHYCFEWDSNRAVGNAVFADGAAAMVLAHGDAPFGDDAPRLRAAAVGSCIIPDSADAMSWNIGNHGYEMFLSPRVPDLIRGHLRPWFDGWLAELGLRVEDVGSWAVHPGGPRILSAVQECLGLQPESIAASREVLATCGNMSSPTILFILDRLRKSGAKMPCVALGFGPGLAAEAALFR